MIITLIMSKIRVKQFVQSLGVEKIAEHVGVKNSAVYNRIYLGSLPTEWFYAVYDLCHTEGILMDRRVFNFREPKSGFNDALILPMVETHIQETTDPRVASQ